LSILKGKEVTEISCSTQIYAGPLVGQCNNERLTESMNDQPTKSA